MIYLIWGEDDSLAVLTTLVRDGGQSPVHEVAPLDIPAVVTQVGDAVTAGSLVRPLGPSNTLTGIVTGHWTCAHRPCHSRNLTLSRRSWKWTTSCHRPRRCPHQNIWRRSGWTKTVDITGIVWKGSPLQCISWQMCVLVGRFILGLWLNGMTYFFAVFSKLLKNGSSLPKTSFISIHHDFNQNTKKTSPPDSPRDALGRWLLPWKKFALLQMFPEEELKKIVNKN